MLLKALKWGQNSILHHILLLMRVIKQRLIIWVVLMQLWNIQSVQLTPHVSLDVGYTSDNNNSSGAYGFVKYTLGTSKFAWRGGKHSESAITTARSKMLDKVRRSDMVVQETVEETYDHGVVDVGL